MGTIEGKTETGLVLHALVAGQPIRLIAKRNDAPAGEGRPIWEFFGLAELKDRPDLKDLIKTICAIPPEMDGMIPSIQLEKVFVGYRPEPSFLTFLCKIATESKVRGEGKREKRDLFEFLFAHFAHDQNTGYLLSLDVIEPIPLSGLAKVQLISGLLDEVSIDQIRIAYASCDHQELEMLRPVDWDLPRSGPITPGQEPKLTVEAKKEPIKNIPRGLSLAARIGSEAYRQDLILSLTGGESEEKKEAVVAEGAPGRDEKTTKELREPSAPPPAKGAEIPGVTRKWFNVQKTLGPVYMRRIGFEWRDQQLGFLLDVAIDLMGLTVGLTGLRLGFPLLEFIREPRPETLKKIDFGLDGLDIAYRRGPIEISGAFLEQEVERREDDKIIRSIEYSGTALIRTKEFTIAGLGSYTTVDNEPSLFVYALYQGTLGGPACFVVTAIAAGFGYNREIKVPPVEKVKEFPLVSMALSPDPNKSHESALVELMNGGHIPPAPRQYWLAAGIRFTSFKLIESFALLSVQFGVRFELAILGISTFRQPAGGAKDPIAYVQMALQVRFSPDEGILAAKAVLTADSYIFAKACKLMGGFAFYMWFSGEHEGDFVVTLGGYHPRFALPSHYPTVPRLGFNWLIGTHVTVKGECYCALTPSCVMAGGNLSIVYQAGNLRAWFIAYADFLISWEPFHYDIAIGVSIGASYRMKIFGSYVSFSVSLGAMVHLWGPPFAGTAQISWWIISFTVRFGAHDRLPSRAPIGWDQFQRSFLPQGEEKSEKADPITIGIIGGLIKEGKDEQGNRYTVVNPDQLVLITQSAIPVAVLKLNSKEIGRLEKKVGIRPMHATSFGSDLEIAFKKGNTDIFLIEKEKIRKGVPEALWGLDWTKDELKNDERVISDVLTGVTLAVPEPPKPAPIEMSRIGFMRETTMCSLRKSPEIQPAPTYDEQKAMDAVADSIMDGEVNHRRKEILQVLSKAGFPDVPAEVALMRMARRESLKSALLAPPILVGIGEFIQRQVS